MLCESGSENKDWRGMGVEASGCRGEAKGSCGVVHSQKKCGCVRYRRRKYRETISGQRPLRDTVICLDLLPFVSDQRHDK